MKLQVIIDGYNLMGARSRGFSKGSFMTESSRELLIRELSGYHQRKGHAVTVVFDGWRDGFGTEHREFRSGVEVLYSRRGERADQVIQRMSRELGPNCAVVSSDREVVESARAAGAFVMGALEFVERLTGPSLSTQPVPWKKDEERDIGTRRPSGKKGNPKKLPKAVRARRRKLKGF